VVGVTQLTLEEKQAVGQVLVLVVLVAHPTLVPQELALHQVAVQVVSPLLVGQVVLA
jgi:hypothetical protein